MEIGLVRKVDIESEMQQAYLDYAMSVIVSRALPDARDGLKPVHRRILYAMYDMGLRSDSGYKKSARIVGEVLGKYHPHGDMAVYDAMARMAQDFSMRTPLVDGQGNFGSMDGDPPAAMRYTEARLAAPTMELLTDLQKDTVDFVNNFDDTLTEPSVLPAALPNLLVNGASGIAVGMATSIPPHNLGEVVDALIYMLNHWTKLDDISVDNLMEYIQGPDFPTGGVILQEAGEEGLTKAYGTGRGRITVQASIRKEEMGRGRSRLVITELPYMTNKSSLLERIASLSREGHLEGLADLRDESDRQGLRIVLELTKTADHEALLRELYRRTGLRTTFSIIMLALVDGEPRLLSLKQALRVYLDHRLNVVRRRSEHDLNRARKRAHILEGLRLALQNLDEVIALIRRSPDVDRARSRLRKRFKLSQKQAQAILDMPLRRLASLERKKIDQEYRQVLATIKSLERLLRSSKKMRQLVADELLQVKETYADSRRTRIVHLKKGEEKVSRLTTSDLVPATRVWVMVSKEGLIARTRKDKRPRLSGRDAPVVLGRMMSTDTVYLVAEDGQAAAIAVHALPAAEKPSAGLPISKVTSFPSNSPPVELFSLPSKGEQRPKGFVVTITRGGMVKKTALEELPGPSAHLFRLVKVNQNDRLGWVRLSQGKDNLLLATAQGMAIRFSEDDVRPMGLVAAGVMGIKLRVGDEVVGAVVLKKRGEVFFQAADGTAKRVSPAQFPRQGRYGQGVVAWKLAPGIRLVGMAFGAPGQLITLHLAKLAPKMVRLDAAPLRTRAAGGKRILELKPGDRVIGLTIPIDLTGGRRR